jgi:hypothetical protein
MLNFKYSVLGCSLGMRIKQKCIQFSDHLNLWLFSLQDFVLFLSYGR